MKFEELIQDFKEEDFNVFFDFVKKNFHENYILLKKEFLNWQYKTQKGRGLLSIKLIKYKNDLLGYLGVIPLDFIYFGEKIKVKCFANMMVDKSARKLGLGTILVKDAEKETDLIYVVGYNQAISKLYSQIGWTIDIKLRRFVYVLNSKKTGDISGKAIPQFQDNLESRQDDLSFEKIDGFDESINVFFNKVKQKYPITVFRNNEYLNWRYVDHPLLRYEIYASFEGKEITSFIVFRIEEAEDFKIARIIDLISSDNAEKYTLKKIIEYCRKRKIDLIDFFFTGKFHEISLYELGFIEADKEPFTSIPILFSPMETGRRQIKFGFKAVNKYLFDKRLFEIDNWYITKGDGDQDRPNFPPENE